MRYQVLINGYYDITELCGSLPEIVASCESDLEADNTVTVEVYSQNHEFSLLRPSSFFGVPLNHFTLTISNAETGRTLFSGQITELKETTKETTTLTAKSSIESLSIPVVAGMYDLSLLDIFEQMKKDYGIKFSYSDVSILTANTYNYSVRYLDNQEFTVQNLLSEIAEALCLFIYWNDGKIHFKQKYYASWSDEYFAEIPVHEILEWDIDRCYSDIINQYTYRYYLNSDSPLTDTAGLGTDSRKIYGEQSIEIDASQYSNFWVLHKEAAQQAAECYLYRFRDYINKVTLSLVDSYWDAVLLGENYIIDGSRYQIIRKTLDISARKMEIEGWECT